MCCGRSGIVAPGDTRRMAHGFLGICIDSVAVGESQPERAPSLVPIFQPFCFAEMAPLSAMEPVGGHWVPVCCVCAMQRALFRHRSEFVPCLPVSVVCSAPAKAIAEAWLLPETGMREADVPFGGGTVLPLFMGDWPCDLQSGLTCLHRHI